MRVRLITALLAAFALLVAPAAAQDPAPTTTPVPSPTATPTPTPTPEPSPERSDEVKAIYRDYRRDGELDACKHEKADLKKALKDLTDEDDAENPDLRYLLEAAIDEHTSGDCKRKAEEKAEQENTGTGTGTTGTGTTGTGTGTTTPSPVTPVTPVTPTVPDSTFSPSDGGSSDPLGGGDLTPVDPDEVTPVPPADAPPSTTIPPAEAGGAPIPAAPPAPVYTNADDDVPLPLLILAGVVGAIALIALLLALMSRAGWGERALAGPRRAWREAAFRAGGTWGDFADWMRVGR